MENEHLKTFQDAMKGTSQRIQLMKDIDQRIDDGKRDNFSNYIVVDATDFEHDRDLQQDIQRDVEKRGMVVQLSEPRRRMYNATDYYLKDMKIYWEDVPEKQLDQSTWPEERKKLLSSLLSQTRETVHNLEQDDDIFSYVVKAKYFNFNRAVQKALMDAFRGDGYTVTMEPPREKIPMDMTWNVRITWDSSKKKRKL